MRPLGEKIRPYSFSSPKMRCLMDAPRAVRSWAKHTRGARRLQEREGRSGEDLAHLGGRETAEAAAGPVAVQYGDLQPLEGELLVGHALQRLRAEGERDLERRRLALVALLQEDLERLRPPADRGEAPLVEDAAVERDAVHLVGAPRLAHLRDEDLDLQRLDLLAEDRPQALRVGVRERARGH